MRTIATTILTTLAATILGFVIAGAAAADTVPGDPGGPRRDPAPAAVPDFAPNPGQQRPTSAPGWPAHADAALKGQADAGAGADAAIDAMLGMLPQHSAAAEGAKHIYVTEDGELGCVTLDTFFPEAC